MTDWKPVNPCTECEALNCTQCHLNRDYEIAKFYQRKLLGALKNGTITIDDCNGNDIKVITEDMIDSMLKQLEEVKE